MVKDANHHNNSNIHVPVLLGPVLEYLAPKKGNSYLDLTAGYGGHATEVIAKIASAKLATLVDQDSHAIEALQPLKHAGATLVHKDYLSAAKDLIKTGQTFDLIMADLGVSSPHLDNAQRGFSFQFDAPLDMRMDQRQALTAQKLLNTLTTKQLIEVLSRYGEEPRATKIASAIINARPLKTTKQLADIVEKTIGRRGKIHPATRTFQAIRIAVNHELDQLANLLPLLSQLLRPGGRVSIISFHSLEDRLVKQYFAERGGNHYDASFKILTKKPIDGSKDDVFNPRARSAKLRVAAKINK